MKRFAILLLSLFSVAWGSTVPRLTFPPEPIFGRIFGGEETTIEDVPFQVVLQRFARIACGGSILSRDVVLTAAHCTTSASVSAFSIRAGSSMHASGGVIIQVRNKVEHPRYNHNGDYDFSILQLEESLTFGDGIQPIPLPQQGEDVPADTPAMTSGWGLTAADEISPVLQKIYIPIYDQKSCYNSYLIGNRRITDQMICAGLYEGGEDACLGDSGGPLFANDVLVGVTSRGCALKGFPGVYARVPSVVNWIKSFLNNWFLNE